jgi:hypothetical protein
MSVPVKTRDAVRALGTTYHILIGLLRYDVIEPPQRDSSGDYVWTESDLGRARAALAARRRPGRPRKEGATLA